jgi:DNA helicase-2/ATP-dependent DNA helicase PcrA
LEGLREASATLVLPDLLRATLQRSGYGDHLAKEPDANDRLANLEELISAAVDLSTAEVAEGGPVTWSVPAGNDVSDPSLAGSGLSRLAAFLDHISLLTDADSSRGSEEGVRLMTVHAAKGLEFDRVFLVGMEEELFPHVSALAEGHLEEERRLCYVGMTRARILLYLSAARSRRIHGRDRWQEPSRFIHEVDPRHIVVRDHLAAPRGDEVAQPRPTGVVSKESAQQPSGPGPAQDEDLQEGVRVLHPKFGPGKISSRQGSGDKLKLVIRFNRAGTKTLLARYASLHVVG